MDMKEPPNSSARVEQTTGKQRYRRPSLQYFGSVTELTNSALGTCADDSDTNNCGGPNQNMEMRL